jgi:HEAT repeat protein
MASGAEKAPTGNTAAEDKLLAVLRSDAPAQDKCNACRELKTIGTERSVEALAGLLTVPDTSHAARIALESMPYPAAGAALRAAAAKATGLTKAGILDSLGERRDAEATALLAAALQDADPVVVAAAAVALGKIGTPAAADALTAAREKAKGPAREAIGEGLLICADRLLAAGDRQRASDVYVALSAPGEPLRQRTGALRGQLRAAPASPAVGVAMALAGDDTLLRAAAAGMLPQLSPAEFRELAARRKTLPAASQVAVLAAIRIRGDRSLAPIALEAAANDNESVRVMAVRALGIVGDAAAVPLLVRLSAAKDRPGDAAREGLTTISGPGVDEALLAAMEAEKDAARRAEWVALIGARGVGSLVPRLLAEARQPDPAVRARAVAALAARARLADVPAMAELLLATPNGPEREEVERAIRLVCQQIADAQHRADPVLDLLQGATAAKRIDLLPLVGRLGGERARLMIDEALRSTDPALYAAGVRALSNWPDASVADQLLRLAETAPLREHRLWALRGFIHVVVLPGKTSEAEKLALLRRAMQLATADEERVLVVQRASAVRTVEALRFLRPCLDQPALAEEAGKSIVELARHKELAQPNRGDFEPALKQVIRICKDPLTVEKARRLLGTL